MKLIMLSVLFFSSLMVQATSMQRQTLYFDAGFGWRMSEEICHKAELNYETSTAAALVDGLAVDFEVEEVFVGDGWDRYSCYVNAYLVNSEYVIKKDRLTKEVGTNKKEAQKACDKLEQDIIDFYGKNYVTGFSLLKTSGFFKKKYTCVIDYIYLEEVKK